MNDKKIKICQQVAAIGMVLIAIGIIMPFVMAQNIEWVYSPWGSAYKVIYTVGAVAAAVARIVGQPKVENLRLQRLYRLEVWSSLFFCVAAFFLWYPAGPFPTNFRDVLAFTLVAGAIQLYVSIMVWYLISKSEK